MMLEVLRDADLVARRAADIIATEAQAAVAARGRFVMAVSGGRTPWAMLRKLSALDMPWPEVHMLQVDERVAPANHPDRNLTHLTASLASFEGSVAHRVEPMPVEMTDLEEAALRYGRTVADAAGSPPILDLVHLGLGTDGHTASLVPGDPVLNVIHADVAVTGLYQGRQRMTLTYPVINRARRILWVITGADKAEMLARLRRCDSSIPAGRVRQQHAVVLADDAAARRERP
jgi:6-phosphogluconolactonase